MRKEKKEKKGERKKKEKERKKERKKRKKKEKKRKVLFQYNPKYGYTVSRRSAKDEFANI